MRIDLNADVGEWIGDDPARETDAALLALVTSVNVACGAHAGGTKTMAVTVDLAAFQGLAIGAHPGYPDREGFGRRHLDLTIDELRATLFEQVEGLAATCAASGVRLTHVKAHGALYNQAAKDPRLAHTITSLVREIDERLALVGPPGSALLAAAADVGLRPVAEAFADRAYEPDGTLRSRSLPDAVLPDPDVVAAQALSIARDGRVRATDGSWLVIEADTICLHGDAPEVVAHARAMRAALAVANLLLGDDAALPALELSGGLPELLVRVDAVIAVAGADLGLRAGADGPWIRPGTSVLVRTGTVVRATSPARAGHRTYLALPGGIDVPWVLGSASTSPVGGFGGHEGRILRTGDLVRAADPDRRTGAGHTCPGPASASGVARGPGAITLTVTDGPHIGQLSEAAARLLATDFVVGDASDRVGLRLAALGGDTHRPATEGDTHEAATHELALDSFALTWGAVELPPDGDPILVMPDGPTVGGYPVPLVVAGADLPRLGQVRPGDHVCFRYVDPALARAERLAADAALDRCRAALAVMRSIW